MQELIITEDILLKPRTALAKLNMQPHAACEMLAVERSPSRNKNENLLDSERAVLKKRALLAYKL